MSNEEIVVNCTVSGFKPFVQKLPSRTYVLTRNMFNYFRYMSSFPRVQYEPSILVTRKSIKCDRFYVSVCTIKRLINLICCEVTSL